jgi:hypothetical protein
VNLERRDRKGECAPAVGYISNVKPDDGIDRREWLRSQPSSGPAWDAAIDFGIDVSLISENLSHSMSERFAESVRMTRFSALVESARERLHGAGQ